MTVEIVHAQNNMVATLDAANDGLARLGQWVDAARNARQLVAPLVETPFVPDNYRPKVDPRATPEQKQEAYNVAVATATAAVLQGISLGIDPLTSLQQIYIVHGRPGMYAKMMVALVQAHGHEVWDEDLTDTRAVVAGRRAGTDNIVRITVTIDQARRAGWTKNEAYGKTPQDMLWARAASRVCDRIASDVLKGIASIEQIRDETATPGAGTRTVRPRIQATAGAPIEPPLDVEPEQPARRGGRRAVAAEVRAEPEPELDEPVADLAPVPITAAQQKKLHALLTEHGLGNRSDGLARISQILGREVDTTKSLSKADAIRVIDRLEEPSEEPPLDDAGWPATPDIPAGE